jgi:PKD repeat protein
VSISSEIAIASAVLAFGDGSQTNLGNAAGNFTVNHTYAASGTFVVELTVTGTFGNKSTARTNLSVLDEN